MHFEIHPINNSNIAEIMVDDIIIHNFISECNTGKLVNFLSPSIEAIAKLTI